MRNNAKYPYKDEQGKIIWKNLFKIDWMTLIFFVIIISLSFFYAKDTKECRAIIEHPCEALAKTNCCNYIVDGEFNPYQQLEEPNITQLNLNEIKI